MPTSIPSPADVLDFPIDNPRLKIVNHKGHLYVIERHYRWDPLKKRGVDDRTYVGKVHEGRYYSMEEYKRLFKRDGTPRAIRKTSPIKRRTRKTAEAPVQSSSPASTEASAKTPVPMPTPVQAQASVQTPVPASAPTPIPGAKPVPASVSAPENNQKNPEKTKTPTPCIFDSKLAGEVMLLERIARQIGLWQDIARVWGERAADAVLSLACFFIITSKNSVYLYQNWRKKYLVPFAPDLSPKDIMELFSELAIRENWEGDFFSARMARLGDDEVYSYDASNIATEALQIEDAREGKGKKTGIRRQVGLAILFGHKSKLPALFRILPGNIPDVSTVAELLFRFEHLGNRRITATVMDRGYFSKENILHFLRSKRNCLIAAKTSVNWIKDAIEEALPQLENYQTRLAREGVRGCTVPVDLDDTGTHRVWVHVFLDLRRAVSEQFEFLAKLDDFEAQWNNHKAPKNGAEDPEGEALAKSGELQWFHKPEGAPGKCRLVQNADAVSRQIKRLGIFASVSTMECSAAFALETYGQRDGVEKCFLAGKTNLNMDVIRSHSTKTMQGRFIVSFVALTLLCELKRRMADPASIRKKKDGEPKSTLADEYSAKSLLDFLSPIKVIYGGDERRLSEVTKRQKEVAERLQCPYLFNHVPNF